MNQLFYKLGNAVGSIASLYTSKLKSKLMLPQKAIKKLIAHIKKMIQNIIKVIFGKPSSVSDYIQMGELYLSKRFLAKGIVFLFIIGMLWWKVGYPYLNGRLWPAMLVVNTKEFHEFQGKASVYLEDGRLLYQGQIQDGLAEGIGALYNGEGHFIYRGSFSNNNYEGEGELYEGDKLLYRGQFVENLYQGEGELFYPNGNIKFSGIFETGEYQKGILYYESGRKKYTGAFFNGLYTGEGTLFADNIQNSMIYTGSFTNGKYDGTGALYSQGKLLYRGTFANGQYSGAGTLYYGKAAIYEGSFRNGKRNGEGRAYAADGKYLLYEGTFLDDLYDGTGTLYQEESGRILYKGEFLHGVYQGEGILYGSSGQKLYEGRLQQGAIDYMQYVNAEETDIKKAFGHEDAITLLESSFLQFYQQLGVAFEYKYVEMEGPPLVERIRFFGKQNIDGVSTQLTLAAFKKLFAEDALYTEYAFVAGEAETVMSGYIKEEIQMGELLYSVKHVLDGYYIRAYALEEDGKICYFEVGNI